MLSMLFACPMSQFPFPHSDFKYLLLRVVAPLRETWSFYDFRILAAP
jgi:hypothetical protein